MKYLKSGINKNTDEKLRKIEMRKVDSDIDVSRINDKLDLYTIYRDKKYASKRVKYQISNIVYKDGINYYISDEICFPFILLSDYMQSYEERKNLTSKRRYHKCHEKSYSLTLGAPYEESYILTGYVNIDGREILHSVAEIKDEREEKIIDYTKNIVMEKEDYKKITNFRELSKISRDDLRKDEHLIVPFNMNIIYYLLFRDEIIKDLEKNEKLFQLEK